jgi:hypothetical protein
MAPDGKVCVQFLSLRASLVPLIINVCTWIAIRSQVDYFNVLHSYNQHIDVGMNYSHVAVHDYSLCQATFSQLSYLPLKMQQHAVFVNDGWISCFALRCSPLMVSITNICKRSKKNWWCEADVWLRKRDDAVRVLNSLVIHCFAVFGFVIQQNRTWHFTLAPC